MKCPCPSCIFSDLLAYGAGGVCCRNTDRARWSMMISDSVWARGISAPCPRCGAGKHTSYKQSSNDLALPAIRCRRILPRWPDVHPIAMVNIPSICANDHTEQCMIYHNYIDSLNTSQLVLFVKCCMYRACRSGHGLSLPPSCSSPWIRTKSANYNTWILSDL